MVSRTQEDFVFGALIGGAIGVAAILLFTPYSGSELRKQIQNGFGRLNGVKSRRSPSHAPEKVSTRTASRKTTATHTAAKKPKRVYKRRVKAAATSHSSGHAQSHGHGHGHAKSE